MKQYVVTSNRYRDSLVYDDPGDVANLVMKETHNWSWASHIHATCKEMQVGDVFDEAKDDEDFPFVIECVKDPTVTVAKQVLEITGVVKDLARQVHKLEREIEAMKQSIDKSNKPSYSFGQGFK